MLKGKESFYNKKGIFLAVAAILLVSGFFAPNNALAEPGVTITPVSGGTGISIDTTSDTTCTGANCGVFRTLSGPTIIEGSAGDIAVGTHTITLPAGWEFDTSLTVNINASVGSGITPQSQTAVITNNTLTFTIETPSTQPGTLSFISDLQSHSLKVRPTGITIGSSNITYSGTAGIAGVTGGQSGTNFGTLSTVPGALAHLKITDSATGGNVIPAPQIISGQLITVYSIGADQFNNFIGNVVANWSLTNKTGGVADGNLVAAGDNKSAIFTGNLVGTAIIHAVAGSFSADSGVLTVTPGPVSTTNSTIGVNPSTAVVSSGANNITVTVIAKDAAGNLISEKTASIVVTGTGNTVTPVSVSTDSNGVAVFTIFSTKAEAKTITATIDSVTIISSTPSVTFTHGLASQLSVVTQPSTTAVAGVAFTQQPVINVLDSFGNLVTDSSAVITATRNTGIGVLKGLANPVTATAVNGVATFSGVNYEVAEIITIDFTSDGLTLATSGSINVSPNIPATVTFTQQPATAGGDTVDNILSIQPIVNVIDAYGNNVAATDVTLSKASGGGVLRGTVTKATIGGTATFNDIGYSKADVFSITATAGTASATSNAISALLAGIINTFTLSATSPQTAGIPFAVSVSGAVDQFLNLTSGTITVSGGSTAPNGTSQPAYNDIAVVDGEGIAQTTLVNATPTTLTGTAGLITKTTSSITVNPAAASQIVLTSNPGTINASIDVAKAPISSVITGQLKDQYGNTSTTSGIGVVITTDKGAVTATTVTDTNGQVISTLTSGGDITAGVAHISATTAKTVVPTTVTFNDVTPPDAPVITAPTEIKYVNADNYTITGTAEANSLVQVYNSVFSVVASQQLAGGAISFSISAPLAQNSANNFTVTAKDAAGNESLTPVVIATINEDSLSPSVTSYTLDNSIISPNYSVGIKDSATFDVAFSEEVNATVDIVNSSDTLIKHIYTSSGTVINPDPKTWNGKNTNDVSFVIDGVYTIKIVITDKAGNSITNTTKTIAVDNTAPTVALTYSADPAKAGAMTITATYSEPIVGTPQINIDQQGSTDISNQNMVVTAGTDNKIWTYSYTVNTAADTTYIDGIATVSLSAAVADAAGNTADAPTSNIFTIDTTAPTASITSPIADAVVKSGTVSLGFDSTGGSVCEYKVDTGSYQPLASCISPQTITLTDGRNSVVLRVTDAAGNPAESTAVSFVVDTNNTLTVGATGADFTTIQAAINKATAGDTINVAAGIYTEQLLIQKNLILTGMGIDQTIVKAPTSGRATAPAFSAGSDFQADYIVAAYPVGLTGTISVKVTGFTFDANNQTRIGGRFPAVFFRKVNNSTIGDAGLFASKVMGFNPVETEANGIWVEDSAKLTIDGNTFNDFTEFGANIYGYAGYTLPIVTTSNNTFNARPGVADLPVSIVYWFTNTGTISGNTIVGGADGIQIIGASNNSISTNTISNGTRNGILVADGSLNNTISGNAISHYASNGIIFARNSNNNTISNNTISSIISGSLDGWAIAFGDNNSSSNNNTATGNDITTSDVAIENWNGAGNVATGNKIYGNSFGVHNNTANAMNATQNWWGTTDGAAIAAKVSANVNYRPWRTSAVLTDSVDITAPTVTISSTAGSQTNISPIPFSVTFGAGETVYDFTAADITVTNGAASEPVISGSTYTFNMIPTGQGGVAVSIAANRIWDASGNYNTASNSVSVTYDSVNPSLSTVSIASSNITPTLAKVGEVVTLTIIASESIQTPTVTIAGQSATVTQRADAKNWTAAYTMTGTEAEVAVVFNVSFTDLAGNLGTAVAAVTDASSVTFDKTAPVITLASIAGDNYINNTEKEAIVVMGTAEADALVSVSLTNGATVSGSQQLIGGGTTYSITINGTTLTNGTIIPSVTATDATGNISTAVITPTATKDIIVPSVTETSLSPARSSIGIALDATISVGFSEKVIVTVNNIVFKRGETLVSIVGVEFNNTTNVATINPGTLASNETYSVTLNGITDEAGNIMPDYKPSDPWKFTTATGYSISLISGWNLISLPVTPATWRSIPNTLSTVSGKVNRIWMYDASNGKWLVYNTVSSTPSDANFTSLEAGRGYWIEMNASGTLTGSGTLYEQLVPSGDTPSTQLPQIQLAEGWNLIGYYQLPGYTDRPIANALSKLSGAWSGAGSDIIAFSPSTLQPLTPTLTMNPGIGYWLYMNSAKKYSFGN